MRRLLITGGAGFIGANLVHHWLARHPEDRVVVLDALTYAGNRSSLAPVDSHPGFCFVHEDIRSRAAVEGLLRQHSIDTIVHLAAESHVDRSIASPDAFIEVNVAGTHSLLEAARAVWLEGTDPPPRHRFHHVSTDEVYGSLGPHDPGFRETTPYAPNSPYAATKAASDHLVRAYHHTYRLATSISNCSNNYGPYQFPEKLVPLVIVNLLEGRELPVYGDGRNVRDWLYVEDHCRGIERVVERGRPGEVYNIGSDNERTNLDLVERLCRLVDEAFAADAGLARRFPASAPARGTACRSLVRFVADRQGHDRRYAIDASKIRHSLGFRAQTDFEDGLRSTVRWYLDNESWWRAVMDQSYRDWMRRQYGVE